MNTNPRKEKRFYRKSGMSHPVYEAWNLGQAVHHCYLPPRLRTNPYPSGRRHDEWQRGYDLGKGGVK